MRYACLVINSKKGLGMRVLMLLTVILGAGCASQATNPQGRSSAAPPAINEAQRLQIAKSHNLKIVDKDGQQLFCRSNFVTASRIEHDTTCYTADQLEQMEAQTTRDMDRLSHSSAMGGIR
jgi:hypothetical protein